MADPNLRSDYKLVRHLSKTYDPLVGRYWQDLPLIQISASALTTNKRNKSLIGAFSNLPFSDFVFDMNGTGYVIQFTERYRTQEFVTYLNGKKLIHYWFRLTNAERYLRCWQRSSPWFIAPWVSPSWKDEEFKPDLMLEIFTHDEYNPRFKDFMTPTPEVTAIQLDPFRYHHCFSALDIKTFKSVGEKETTKILEEFRDHVIMAGLLCDYLKITMEYMVEIRPEQVHPRREPRKDKKPWSYQYLPRIILIDPHKDHSLLTHEHKTAKDSHASPRPHQRRGHYRVYKAARFTRMRGKRQFVKETWVGPKEWVLNGSVYKVLGV